jgi:hypothetical protein
MYILSTGCQWRYLPKNLPPRGRFSVVHMGHLGTNQRSGALRKHKRFLPFKRKVRPTDSRDS